ncbi:MAG: Polyketide cyclase/dehydrase [Bryobacterales bacterium]|nr:Polyketide cyclase/dehydrase [Bryobacterales bacterium]
MPSNSGVNPGSSAANREIAVRAKIRSLIHRTLTHSHEILKNLPRLLTHNKGIDSPNHYRFITRWRLQATAEEVFVILAQPLEYPRWWPSVYLTVRELRKGDATGKGREFRLSTKGWLPYTVQWDAKTVDTRAPWHIVITASGDFIGRGIWSLVPDGDFVDVTFDWKLSAEKPLLRYLSFVLRPAFEANHRWAMQQGLRDLELEIARGRANTVAEMNAIDQPAAPGFPGRSAIAGALLAAAALAGLAVTSHESRTPTVPAIAAEDPGGTN